ncbi:MAG: DUF6893 family small protein [Friedmanniella sp.]|jgi:hypothetical protein
MRTLGVITTVVIVTATAGAIVIAVRSIPDLRRYLKIRQM